MRLVYSKKKDCSNVDRKQEKMREEREDDLNKMLQFFRECTEQNEHFFWDLQTDETGVVKSIFWSHASQRAEYRDFGDVITFDTTHKTNSKKMPLAMFVGSNNNLKNVIFGQALIGDETAATFAWLFKSFLSCMGNNQPHVILTGINQFLSYRTTGCNIEYFVIALLLAGAMQKGLILNAVLLSFLQTRIPR